MARILCICPTTRDDRELSGLACGHTFARHDYGSAVLEDLSAEDPLDNISLGDPEPEIERILKRCESEGIQGVITTDDYPGTTLASVVANELRLPAPKPRANLFCQHKYYSREKQAAVTPDATPAFQMIDVRPDALMPLSDFFPLFVKPVKSFFSVGAQRVDTFAELQVVKNRWARSAEFFRPFEAMFLRYTGIAMGSNYLLGEGLLKGFQTTLDGYT